MCNMIVVTLLVAFSLLASAQVPQTGVFESCPQCRLDAMPELKRFFHDSILKGEYGDKLSVKFIPGAVPSFILYGADGEELSREEVSDRLNFDELHSWVQGKGFSKKQQQQAQTSTGAASSVQAAAAAAAPVPPVALYEKRLLRRRRVSAAAAAAAAAAPMPTEAGSRGKRGGRMKQRRKRVKGTRLANGTVVGPKGKVLRRRRRRQAKAAAAGGNPAPAKAD